MATPPPRSFCRSRVPYAAVVRDLAGQLEQWQRDNPPVPAMPGVALPPTGENTDRPAKAAKRAGRKNRAEK